MVVKANKKKSSVNLSWGALDKNGDKTYRLHSGQTAVLKSESRFTAAIAGTGGGKTCIGPLWIMSRIEKLLKAGMRSGMVGMVIAPTYKILSRATVPTLVEAFRGTKYEGKFLESKGWYILPNNWGILYLLSSENPDGLEGGQLTIGAWLDEAGQMSHKAWLAVVRRTGVNQSPIFITTTPYLKNWLKYDFLDRFLNGDEDYFVASWESIKNPAYAKKEFERAKGSMSQAAFNMMYGGTFESLEGLVYPEFGSCICEPFTPPIGRNVGGVDFGWAAPFCGLGATLYFDEQGNDVLYIWYERYEAKATLEANVLALPDNKSIWYADPSEPDSINAALRMRRLFVGAKNSIALGVSAVNERILTKRLKVSANCVHLIKEAELYQYPEYEGEGVIKEIPEPGLDHAMDALRYLCMGVRSRKKKSSGKKVMFSRR